MPSGAASPDAPVTPVMPAADDAPDDAAPQDEAEAPPARPPRTAQVAEVEAVLNGLTAYSDLRDYDSLRRLIGPAVAIDTTQLWGGSPAVVTPDLLIQSWASVLGGFDATSQHLDDIVVAVDGRTAIATAQLTADHWLLGERWRLQGSYDFTLEKTGDDWLITSITFNFESEEGDRDLAMRAIEQTSSGLNPGFVRALNESRARRLLSALEGLEAVPIIDHFMIASVQTHLASDPDDQLSLRGMAAIDRFWQRWVADVESLSTSEVIVTQAYDPQRLFVEFRLDVDYKDAEREDYSGYHLVMLGFDAEGRITSLRDHGPGTGFLLDR